MIFDVFPTHGQQHIIATAVINFFVRGLAMSLKNCSFLIFGSLLIISLIGCGNKTKSRSQSEVNPVCSEIDCLSSINWKILLRGQSFPEKTRLDVNGTTLLNECVSKQKYVIDRTSDPEILLLENFYIPKKGELKIDLFDLGSDCGAETKILSNEDVSFSVEKSSGRSEIVILL